MIHKENKFFNELVIKNIDLGISDTRGQRYNNEFNMKGKQ